MIDTSTEIALFLEQIRSKIQTPIVTHAGQDSVLSLEIAQLWVYIYPANISRRQDVIGFQTIHIDIDQIISSRQKIISRLRGILSLGRRVYARNTVVARIDKRMSLDFQEEHHLNAALPGKYRYGLYEDGDLVSLAIFSGGRHMRDKEKGYRSFELLRFCHKGDLVVVGAVSKLIKKFIQDFSPSDIMTYADMDWCQVSSLEKIGFVQVDLIPPQSFFVQEGKRLSVKDSPLRYDYVVKNKGSLKLKLIL